jgi:dTDP-glucose pyrophosphorylase
LVSCTQRFRPITVEKPKVLLPLVNVPLLEYTLEWLALNQVEEVSSFLDVSLVWAATVATTASEAAAEGNTVPEHASYVMCVLLQSPIGPWHFK